jgi:hypothetical protein
VSPQLPSRKPNVFTKENGMMLGGKVSRQSRFASRKAA